MLDTISSKFIEAISSLVEASPAFAEGFSLVFKGVFIIFSIFILAGTILSLLSVPKTPEVWGKLTSLEDGKSIFINHWENIIGRHSSSDIIIKNPRISRQHAALIRDEQGNWKIYDLESSHGIYVNNREVEDNRSVKYGDIIAFASQKYMLEAISSAEKKATEMKRSRTAPIPPWTFALLLTILQFMIAMSLIINSGANASLNIIPAFTILTCVMWGYIIVIRILGIKAFEMEMIAFYLSTIGLGVVGSYAPASLIKQVFAIIAGIFFFIAFSMFLRNINRVKKVRWAMAGATIGLLLLTVILGGRKNGAINWISIKGVSIQLSEIAKLTYIFAGAATLDRIFKKRNIGLFVGLTFVSLAILAYCSDFGTAAIIFITFIVIAYLRSGSVSTIIFICSGAVSAIFLILTAKPYIFARFKSWGHAWQYAATSGYQQVNTQLAINNGGAFGVGPGAGMLSGKHVAAADTDLVFGLMSEEFGLIVGLLAILCIITLAVFAIRSCENSRSTFYTIAACAATSLLLFQTALNVFGAVDILPLTGVTFPFVSNGGSSMIMAWGVLAFLKANDTRHKSGIASRLRRSEQAPTVEKLSGGRR